MRQLFALFVLGTLAVASAPVGAQTSAPGPYYALPSWDQQMPAATRFIVLTDWGSAAVLDRETGLVWERMPASNTFLWVDAMFHCREQLVGNRRSWRLAGYEELTSLLDPTQSNPALPAGNPFQGIGATDLFWTATADESLLDTAAYFVLRQPSKPRSRICPRICSGPGASAPAPPSRTPHTEARRVLVDIVTNVDRRRY